MFLLDRCRFDIRIFFLLLCTVGCGAPARTVTDETAAYWVLSKKGSVSVFRDGRTKHAKKIDQLPADQYSIRVIRLNKASDLMPEGMREISGLKQLYDLNLSRSNVDDQGILQLTDLPQLRTLNLSETSITDACLKSIGRFEKLRNLDLSKTKLSGSGLGDLNGCKKLTELNLSGTSLRPNHLNLLKEFTNLIKLDVSNTYVTDQDLGDLRQALKYCAIITQPEQVTGKGK